MYSFNQISNINMNQNWSWPTWYHNPANDLVTTPAEPLIRYFCYMCTGSQKENITSARVSLYSHQDWFSVHFFRSMSRTTLKFIIIMLFYVHIYMAFIKTHKRPRNRYKEIFTVKQFPPQFIPCLQSLYGQNQCCCSFYLLHCVLSSTSLG